MKVLYFLKWPIIIYLLAYLVLQLGAFLKIRHWPGADEAIMLAYLIIGIAGLMAIIKLISLRKSD